MLANPALLRPIPKHEQSGSIIETDHRGSSRSRDDLIEKSQEFPVVFSPTYLTLPLPLQDDDKTYAHVEEKQKGISRCEKKT